DGGGIIEAEIHLTKRPKPFRQTEPPLLARGIRCRLVGGGKLDPCIAEANRPDNDDGNCNQADEIIFSVAVHYGAPIEISVEEAHHAPVESTRLFLGFGRALQPEMDDPHPFNPQAKAMKSLFFLCGSLPQRKEYKTDACRR
ncbi:hypothetical protein AAIH70_30455, partial [Neorhizobium sp. BT27B]|uniref:hypothetical protein n=1 Tax=Neorhizobium sp. BT27B TaxID=3142625 RepID=UPI003D2D3A78